MKTRTTCMDAGGRIASGTAIEGNAWSNCREREGTKLHVLRALRGE